MFGRDKEHSTIIYEAGENETSLLRLGWNKQDPRYMATLIMDTCKVSLLACVSCCTCESMCSYMLGMAGGFCCWSSSQQAWST